MVPPEMRLARVPARLWPAGQRWCAGCQSFIDLADAQGSRCRACNSAATHAARIEKTYGLTSAQYDALLELQGGKCAICRAKPVSKRLAVDHDHKTGEVRGLLCSRCNHDLMGAAWDSLAMAHALVGYIEAPPVTGNWHDPSTPRPVPPAAASQPRHGLAGPGGLPLAGAPVASDGQPGLECKREHYLPSGSMRDASGFWRIWTGPGDPPPF